MGSSSNSENEDTRSLGVRFAESRVGRPIVAGLLFITASFWLTIAAVGTVITVFALLMSDTLVSSVVVGDGTIAGITGIFGLSAIGVGLIGYAAYLVLAYRSGQFS